MNVQYSRKLPGIPALLALFVFFTLVIHEFSGFHRFAGPFTIEMETVITAGGFTF